MKKILVGLVLLMFLVVIGCARRPSEISQIELFDWNPQAAYLIGDSVPLNDITVAVTYDDGTVDSDLTIASEGVSLQGDGFRAEGANLFLQTTTRGDYELRISYGGLTVIVEYSVYDAIVSEAGYYYWDDDEFNEEDKPINAAISAITDGGWILVLEGEYPEKYSNIIGINVSKPLTLRGNGVATISSDAQRTIDIDGFEGVVVIEGFIIESGWSVGGINQRMAASQTEVHVLNNFVKAPPSALAHGNSIQVSGDNSKVIGNTVYVTELDNEDWASSGILVVNASNVLVEDNTIIREVGTSDISLGLVLSTSYERGSGVPSEGNTIRNNTLVGGITGVFLETNHASIVNTVIEGNVFLDIVWAFEFWYGDSEDNTIGRLTNTTIVNNIFEVSDLEWFGAAWNYAPDHFGNDIDYLEFIANNDFGELIPLIEWGGQGIYVPNPS